MGKGSTTTQRTGPDEFGDSARRKVWQMASDVAGQNYQPYTGERVAGPNQLTTDNLGRADQMFDQYANWGGPQVGDASSYMNPFNANVIQGVQGDFDRIRQQQLGAVDERATRAGAFGGSRHGIAAGTALGDVGRAEASQLGQLRQAGYSQAEMLRQQDYQNQMGLQQQRLGSAGQMMNLGLSGGGYLRNLDQAGLDARYGDYLEGRDWGRQNLGMLSQTLAGLPQGSINTTEQSGNLLGDIAGIASIGASFIPGVGAASSALQAANSVGANYGGAGAAQNPSMNFGMNTGPVYDPYRFSR